MEILNTSTFHVFLILICTYWHLNMHTADLIPNSPETAAQAQKQDFEGHMVIVQHVKY